MLVYPPSLVKNGPASKSNISKKLKVPKHSAHIMFLYKKKFFYCIKKFLLFFSKFSKIRTFEPLYFGYYPIIYQYTPRGIEKKVEILTIDFFSY